MCGLAGIAGNLSHKDADVARDLVFFSQARGADATGLATYHIKSKEAQIHKLAIPSSLFVESRRADRMFSASEDVILAHTRKSTYQGRSTSADAHPFWHNNLIGAHNGSIPAWALKELPHTLLGGIDSENLIYNISKAGVEEVIPKLSGAWALALLDTERQKLGFIRNKERPLHFAISKGGQRLYWASEAGMLFAVLDRHGIETEENWPVLLAPDTYYDFDLASGKPIGESWTQFKLEGRKEEKKSQGGTTGYGAVIPLLADQTKKKKKHNSPVAFGLEVTLKRIKGLELALLQYDFSRRPVWAKSQKARFNSLMMQIQAAYADLELITSGKAACDEDFLTNVQMTRGEFKELYHKNGCVYCTDNGLDDENADKYEYSKSGDILCPSCAEDPTLRALSGLHAMKEEPITCN
jgi:predicted glutamine amidotransferase